MEAAVSAEEDLDAGEDFGFNADAIRKQFDEMDFEGVELIRAESSVQNGRRQISMAVKFQSLPALSDTPFFSERRVAVRKTGEGQYTFTQKARASGISPEAGAEMPAMMKGLFQGLKMQICVKTPGRITASNATETKGNEARWVYDIAENPESLSKILNLDVQVSFEGDNIEMPGFETHGTK